MSTPEQNRAGQTLVLALESLALAPAATRAGFLRAELLPRLDPAWRESMRCVQTWYPQARALERHQFQTARELAPGDYQLILFLPTRDRDENLLAFATAMERLAPGGILLCAMENDLGAKRFEEKLRSLSGNIDSLSKHHCRAFWTKKSESLNQPMLAEWRALGTPKEIPGTALKTVPGIFCAGKIDRGSEILSRFVSGAFQGRGCDLGCGYGALAHAVLSQNPAITELYLIEAEHLALDLCRSNLAPFADRCALHFQWGDVAHPENDAAPAPETLDWAIMNPPFHQHALHSLAAGEAFINRAARLLRPGGVLMMVANSHLHYASILKSAFSKNEVVSKEAGYVVTRAER